MCQQEMQPPWSTGPGQLPCLTPNGILAFAGEGIEGEGRRAVLPTPPSSSLARRFFGDKYRQQEGAAMDVDRAPS